MVADWINQLQGNDIIVIASVLLIVAAFAVWRLYYVDTSPTVDAELSDGAVLMLSEGIVRRVSAQAEVLLGDCADVSIERVLDNFLSDDVDAAKAAVERLEMMGEPIDMLVRTSTGRAYELIGTPAGAMIRIVLREAGLLETTLRESEEKIQTAETALQNQDWTQASMEALIDHAPIIVWSRSESGTVNWSGGEIRASGGVVSAEQAVDLIVARTRLNRQPVVAGKPQKSRIEIVVNDGAETVSLHVIEIVRPDGARIGIATDAGTAATAERTLTRFVQTMTETFAHLTVGLAIFDRNQTLALFNPALVQMWQVEPAWLARRPSLRDIIDELRATRRLPELQDFHKWRSRLINLFENTEAADYEELWHLADGSNIRVLARPHPHGSLAFIFDDVTERMRLEQRYRHSIDLRRATLDGLNEGIAVFGANGLLQFVNQAFHEIWGTDSEAIYAAMHARQLINFCEDLTAEHEVWHRLHSFITGEDNRRTWTARLTLLSHRVLTARFAPLPDGSTMAVFTDITDAERVAAALRVRNEAMDIVDAGRSAITDLIAKSVEPTVAVLSGQQADPATAARDLQTALAGISSIAGSRLSSGGYETIRPALEDCALILAHKAQQAGITLDVGDVSDDEDLSIDVQLAGHMAFGMAVSAIGCCAEGSTLRISWSSNAERQDLRLEAAHPSGPVLVSEVDDALALISDRLHALATRNGVILDVDGSSPSRAVISCHFAQQRLPVETASMLTDTADDGGAENVHPLRVS